MIQISVFGETKPFFRKLKTKTLLYANSVAQAFSLRFPWDRNTGAELKARKDAGFSHNELEHLRYGTGWRWRALFHRDDIGGKIVCIQSPRQSGQLW